MTKVYISSTQELYNLWSDPRLAKIYDDSENYVGHMCGKEYYWNNENVSFKEAQKDVYLKCFVRLESLINRKPWWHRLIKWMGIKK